MSTHRLLSAASLTGLALAAILFTVAFNSGGPKGVGPADRAPASGPGKSVAAAEVRTDAQTAVEAARNEAELAAMFTVVGKPKPALPTAAGDAQGERGKQVYLGLCYACHQPDGRGLPGAFPMLAKSDFLLADRTRAIRIVLRGLAGPVTVNGQTLNSVMPPQAAVLTDEQIADVLAYVFQAWGNPGGVFTATEVGTIRAEMP